MRELGHLTGLGGKFHGFLSVPQFIDRAGRQNPGEVVENPVVLGLESEGFGVILDGVLVVTEREVGISPSAKGRRVFGVHSQYLLVDFDSLAGLLAGVEQRCQLQLECGIFGGVIGQQLDVLDCLGVILLGGLNQRTNPEPADQVGLQFKNFVDVLQGVFGLLAVAENRGADDQRFDVLRVQF